MTEKLEDKLVEIIGSIQSATAQVGDFAIAQLPDIASQYIIYGRVNESITMVVAVALLIISIKAGLWAYKNTNDLHINWFIAFFGGIIGLTTFALNISSFCLVWLAPKVWLLKALAGLVK